MNERWVELVDMLTDSNFDTADIFIEKMMPIICILCLCIFAQMKND